MYILLGFIVFLFVAFIWSSGLDGIKNMMPDLKDIIDWKQVIVVIVIGLVFMFPIIIKLVLYFGMGMFIGMFVFQVMSAVDKINNG